MDKLENLLLEIKRLKSKQKRIECKINELKIKYNKKIGRCDDVIECSCCLCLSSNDTYMD